MHVACTTSDDHTFDSGTSSLATSTGGDVGSLAPDASASCTFDVGLPANAPTEYAGHQASQVLRWTLTDEPA
ncbi:MAG: hypothetical protein QM747_19825 [Nocardioides sp.]